VQADVKTDLCTSGEDFDITIKENTAVSIYRPNFKPFIISFVGKFTLIHHLRRFTPIIRYLVLCSTRQREF
jgi:hypothetical protein